MGAFTPQLKQLTNPRLDAAQRPDLGQLNFEVAIRNAKIIQRLARAFDRDNPDDLPDGIVQQAQQSLDQLIDLVNRMESLQFDQPEAHQLHRQITDGTMNLLNTWRSGFRQHILGGAIDAKAGRQEAEELLSAARDALDKISETDAAATALLERVQTLAGEVGAGKLAKYYSDQADAHSESARNFLRAAMVSAVLLGVASWVLLHTVSVNSASWEHFARDMITRLFALGILSYAVTFCVRGFRANSHLRVANERRRNALNTFILFQESAASSESREIITVELVRAIFAAEDTGFLDAPSQDKTIVEQQSGLLSLLATRTK